MSGPTGSAWILSTSKLFTLEVEFVTADVDAGLSLGFGLQPQFPSSDGHRSALGVSPAQLCGHPSPSYARVRSTMSRVACRLGLPFHEAALNAHAHRGSEAIFR